MSTVPAPIAIAIFIPSPVAHSPLVVAKRSRSGRCFANSDVFVRSLAKPPVASTVAGARSSFVAPSLAST